jgi:hypothetical protein
VLFVSAIFIAGYILCSLYSRNSKVSFLGALIIFVFATVGISIRPQVIGYLLLIFELLRDPARQDAQSPLVLASAAAVSLSGSTATALSFSASSSPSFSSSAPISNSNGLP